MSFGQDPPGVRRPSLLRRAVVAAVRLAPIAFLLVGVPYLVLTRLPTSNIHSGISIYSTTLGGAALSATATFRYFFRPTRLYGPMGMLHSGVALAYLAFLLPSATLAISAGSGTTVALAYGRILLLLLLVPIFGLAWAAFATVSDLRHPELRLRAEFPAPPPP
jgi:hypothetical protein